jgi:RNA polymerase sigma factor
MTQITQHELTEQVQLAKTDRHTLNILLHNYMPFIKKCVASVFFKCQSRADNLTDAMLGFAHSVQTYNPERGAFIKYAAAVIYNRLIDKARKELSMQKRLEIAHESDVSLQVYNQAEEERNLRIDIEAVNIEFAKWGFSWATLLRKCPKQERSRCISWQIARTVLQDSVLLADTLKTRRLPISRLAEMYPHKALEKYRQYIVALIILSQGDYPYLYSFVPQHFTDEEEI